MKLEVKSVTKEGISEVGEALLPCLVKIGLQPLGFYTVST